MRHVVAVTGLLVLPAGTFGTFDLGADAYKSDFIMNAVRIQAGACVPTSAIFKVNDVAIDMVGADQLSDYMGSTVFRPMGHDRYLHYFAFTDDQYITVSRLDPGERVLVS
jgi:hypothetical protein